MKHTIRVYVTVTTYSSPIICVWGFFPAWTIFISRDTWLIWLVSTYGLWLTWNTRTVAPKVLKAYAESANFVDSKEEFCRVFIRTAELYTEAWGHGRWQFPEHKWHIHNAFFYNRPMLKLRGKSSFVFINYSSNRPEMSCHGNHRCVVRATCFSSPILWRYLSLQRYHMESA